ncbi:hypothetical protein ACQJBY_002313 [Aegilops geniculata]
MLVRKFQKLSQKNRFGKSSKSSSKNDEASTHDYKERTCHKCKKLGHYISECPQWEKEAKKRRRARNMTLTERRRRNPQSLTLVLLNFFMKNWIENGRIHFGNIEGQRNSNCVRLRKKSNIESTKSLL